MDKGIKNGVYITRKIMQAFGLQDYLAVGFAGCWMAESKCNPGAYNKAEKAGKFKGSSANGKGYGAGLAQWSNAWKKKILDKFNRHTDIETWTMDQLIEIVTKMCAPSFINLLKNSSNASQSTDIILRGYENGSGGSGTTLRSLKSMKAYTWCKRSYVPDIGYKNFPDGYIGALTERTAWANKILLAMGSLSLSDLSGIGDMSFYDLSSDGGGTAFGSETSGAYPVHNEYETYSGTGGNIFSNAGDNAFVQAAMSDNSMSNSKDTKHTRIYSTNDSCIILDELALPLDIDRDESWSNKGVTEEDVNTRKNSMKTGKDTSTGNTLNKADNNAK